MKPNTISSHNLSTMCRLCLTRGVIMVDIFRFSSKLGKEIADIIMKCAPILITKHDEMPTCICRLCYIALEKVHQFQMQAVQSEKTLRHYIRQLNSSEKHSEFECLIQSSSKELGNQKASSDNISVNCDSLEINDGIGMDISRWKQKTPETQSIGNNKSEDKLLKCDDICNVQIKEMPLRNIQLSSTNLYKETEFLEAIVDSSFSDDGDRKTVHDDTKSDIDEAEVILDTVYPRCMDVVNKVQYLSKHKANENPSFINKPYQCCVCKINFRKLFDLNRHQLTHTGEKPYQCLVCKICFSESGHLKSHKLIHTGGKPYQCEICKMNFRRSPDLKRHKLIHTGEKPYQCDVCKVHFRESGHLKSHKLTHTGEKPHQCDVCKMWFRHSTNLKSHKLIHTGEKPYKCDVCKMCFRQSVNLKNHKLIHTGEKPYQCDVCKICFRESGHLKNHKLIHTGEKPHQCDVCKMCFRVSSSLKKHSSIHYNRVQ